MSKLGPCVRLKGTHIDGDVQQMFVEHGERLYLVWWRTAPRPDIRLYKADELENALELPHRDEGPRYDMDPWKDRKHREEHGLRSDVKREIGHRRL